MHFTVTITKCVTDDLGCTVEQFLAFPFSRQYEIICKGQSSPAMPGLTKVSAVGGAGGYTRNIQVNLNEKMVWLTGRLKLNKLFC